MKANRGTVWINAGLLLIAAALFLSAYNERESHEARDSARQVIAQLCDALPTEAGDDEAEPTTLPESLPDVRREMPVKTINGRDYIGVLSIPSLELELPVIVHDREAHGDSLEIVKEFPGVRGVFHCFSGSPEMAEELLKRGWYLGFDGPVTYKNARRAPEVVAVTPLDRIVVETDAPYMSPVPNRGRRNDSRNLPYIVEKLAEWKGISPEEMAAHTWNNGLRLFGLEGKV